MTTLIFYIISTIAIFPTISPFGIDGNIIYFHFSPFDIKGKGLKCLLRLPLTMCFFLHSTVILAKENIMDSLNAIHNSPPEFIPNLMH